MLIPLQEIVQKYNLNIKGVIQVGAHWAEEHEDYLKLGIERFVYIEPCDNAYTEMWNKLFSSKGKITCLHVACGAEESTMVMNVSHNNQGQSNSLLKPKLHLNQHPEVVFADTERVNVIPLDKLPFNKEDYNLLVMDVQGYEGEVLKGATETLKYIDIIYTEINTGETYEDNMLVGEMDGFLGFYGFYRVETMMASANLTWGDAVYLKEHLL